MNRNTVIASILLGLAVAIILVTAFVLLRAKPGVENPTTTSPSGTIFPSSFSATSTVTIAGQDSTAIEVRDFVHNGETIQDVVNPGNYVLAGSLGYCLADGTCPKAADTQAFSISYDEKSASFGIVLLKEPLGETRLAAEAFLSSRLGISRAQLCSLTYYIGTPYWVNEQFSANNLGFSLCPDATTLP